MGSAILYATEYTMQDKAITGYGLQIHYTFKMTYRVNRKSVVYTLILHPYYKFHTHISSRTHIVYMSQNGPLGLLGGG